MQGRRVEAVVIEPAGVLQAVFPSILINTREGLALNAETQGLVL
jgi:hypothetical protein